MIAKPRPATALARSNPRRPGTASCEIKPLPSKKQTDKWLSFQEFITGVPSNQNSTQDELLSSETMTKVNRLHTSFTQLQHSSQS
jgi:hypothetical protein